MTYVPQSEVPHELGGGNEHMQGGPAYGEIGGLGERGAEASGPPATGCVEGVSPLGRSCSGGLDNWDTSGGKPHREHWQAVAAKTGACKLFL